MDRQQLESQYHAGTIGKLALGKLRRLSLTAVLDDIEKLPDLEIKLAWLDNKLSKIERKKLADAVGFDTKPDTLRQTLKDDVVKCEGRLRDRGLIVNQAKTTKQVGDENAANFLAFIDERLDSSTYQWPINNRKRLYHKKLWSFFLDQPMDEIKSAPKFFSGNNEVREKLASIDMLFADNAVKTLSYAEETALDEMQDTMTSAALSTLRQQLKEVTEKLAAEREARKDLESKNHELKLELKQYKARDLAMTGTTVSSLKIAGAH